MEREGKKMEKAIICPGRDSKVKVFPVNVGDVKLKGLLGSRIETNRRTSIPSLYKSFLEYGTVDNFRIASGEKKGSITRRLATDSDLYKWMEAVSCDLQNEYDRERARLLDKLISLISKTQEKSGYIDTFYAESFRKERFKNLYHGHELYCGGHLIQSAIAHHRATGKDSFLDVAVKWADFICRKFGKGRIEENDGHPEVEMALVELYRTTGREKYLELAGFFMSKPYKILDGHAFLEFPGVTGHAVRMIYLCSGATDYCIETGDRKYLGKLLSLWEDMAGRKTYITGGIGSRYSGETFGMPYELPNLRAYAESCAAIASMMWNYRMFLITGEGRFMDLFENTLYNGFLSGVSLDGREYFYVNPLASRGEHRRKKWYDCTCCPPNIQRMLASLPGYFYGVSKEGLWVNLYGESESVARLFSGNKVRMIQKTGYPYDGKVSLEISPERSEEFSIFLRIPRWADNCIVKINGRKFTAEPGQYFAGRHLWESSKENVEIDFGLKPVLYSAHPEIESTKGCAAIKRGPVLYCLESVDNPGVNLFNCRLEKTKLKERFEPDLLGGTHTVSGEILSGQDEHLPLYEKADRYPDPKFSKRRFKAIPYHLWANRGTSRMAVWLGKHI